VSLFFSKGQTGSIQFPHVLPRLAIEVGGDEEDGRWLRRKAKAGLVQDRFCFSKLANRLLTLNT